MDASYTEEFARDLASDLAAAGSPVSSDVAHKAAVAHLTAEKDAHQAAAAVLTEAGVPMVVKRSAGSESLTTRTVTLTWMVNGHTIFVGW